MKTYKSRRAIIDKIVGTHGYYVVTTKIYTPRTYVVTDRYGFQRTMVDHIWSTADQKQFATLKEVQKYLDDSFYLDEVHIVSNLPEGEKINFRELKVNRRRPF